ncbi:hypothetical protein D2Q93_14960 [Alicyclobacillaceae bacterium I2511]|nr:hypothetical protein D2Q93_14960 [Alicyclobacillaceae bacterium I2511]
MLNQTDPNVLYQETQKLLARLGEQYTVPDIITENSTCIFILESPHIQELQYGAPVAGASGATMSKHLFGPEYGRFPLGRLVKKNVEENKNRPRLNRIGLLNVCNVPLQGNAYKAAWVPQELGEWLRDLASLRTNNQRDNYGSPRLNAIQAVLLDNLRAKLVPLQSRNLSLVPCGRFAQKFFRLAQVSSPKWQVIQGVPHPSYNSWDRVQYAEVVAQVRETLKTQAFGDTSQEHLENHKNGSILT